MRTLELFLTGNAPDRDMAADYKKLVLFTHIAYSFPSAVLAGALLGWLIDSAAGTKPLFIVLGFLAGMAGGFWNLFRLLDSVKDGD